MNGYSPMIVELVKAANRVQHIPDVDRARLLFQSFNLIRDAERQAVGFNDQAHIPASFVSNTSHSASFMSDDDVRSALLNAAGVLIELRIASDARPRLTVIDKH